MLWECLGLGSLLGYVCLKNCTFNLKIYIEFPIKFSIFFGRSDWIPIECNKMLYVRRNSQDFCEISRRNSTGICGISYTTRMVVRIGALRKTLLWRDGFYETHFDKIALDYDFYLASDARRDVKR